MVTSSEHDDLHRGTVTGLRHLLLALPADLTAPAAARLHLRAWLTAHEWPGGQQDDLVLAVSEAVSNAVEHGYGVRPGTPGRPGVVKVSAELLAGRRVEITVRDRGGWRAPPPLRGYRRHGLPIMKACTAECVIDGTPAGTTVVLRSHPG